MKLLSGLHGRLLLNSALTLLLANSLLLLAGTLVLRLTSGTMSLLLLMLDLCFVPWFYLLYQQSRQTEAEQLQQAEAELQLRQLLQDAHLPLQPDASLAERLQLLRQSQQFQQKREQEIRQLVRVQGLVDHELAIGNRIYFESKLQHYLQDGSEAPGGALFLLQISHPELAVSTQDALQRMTGCADLLQQLTSHYSLAVLARVADTDFGLLIPGMQQKEAEQLGDRLAMVLSRASFFAGLGDFDLVHLGYVIYQQGQSMYQLMAEADMALKTAQLQGPNAAYGFYPEHKPKIKGSVWWRTELHNALEQNRFLLSFQPVFAWPQQEIMQHEVLVRLQSSEGEILTAAVFLPMAVNCALTAALDQYVLAKAARLCLQEQKNTVRCSINITAESLQSADFQQWLDQQLRQGELAASQLALEIDEYHLIKNYRKIKGKLMKLKQAGFSLIIDHVGLNISPCEYLTELPIDAVKLHSSVVRNIDSQLEQQLFIRGLVASHLAKGVKVIATGVETQAQWQTLQKLGVSGAQGFYFSQPLAELVPAVQIS